MDNENAKELIAKIDQSNKHLAKIAEVMSVLKVMVFAFFIALLMVVFKNFG